jgi:hypothetical protein
VNGADGKPAPGYARSTLSGARLGDASFGDIKILVTDIQQYIKKDHMPAADGSLAYTAFKDRLLELDYIHHTVRVSELLTGDVKCPKFCGTITTLTFGKKGPPIVVSTGFSIHGKQVTAQVDTLFSGSMLIYPGSVQKLGLDQAAKTTAKRFFKYTDDGVDILESLSHEECFGDRVLAKNAAVYFATPAVHLPDDMFDATVGDELFRRSVLTLDFHNMKLWM